VFFAVLLIAHGIAHLVGFVVPWGLVAAPDLMNRTTVLNGSFDIGAAGARAFGIVWLALALGFVVAGAAFLAGWHDNIWIVRLAGLSLVFCVVGWPDARIGILVNAAIIAAVFALQRISLA
jgi:hypothetical protein